MTEPPLLDQINRCISLFEQANQCTVFNGPAVVLVSSVGIIATLAMRSFLAWRRAALDNFIARRRATLDILLMEETKPELVKQRAKFNALCQQKQGDLSRCATKENINLVDAKLLCSVLNQYELVSIGVRQKIIDEESYRAWCRTTLVKDWMACKPFVTQLRQTTKTPAYYNEFEKLACSWANAQEKPHV